MKTALHCQIHPHVALVCPACLGAATKGITSKAKAKASAANGRLGGRPKLPRHSDRCVNRERAAQAAGLASSVTPGCPRCAYDAHRSGQNATK
jgi:hypothetical protein